MVRCNLFLLAMVLFVSTQNTNGLKCFICQDCEDVEGKTMESCSPLIPTTTPEPEPNTSSTSELTTPSPSEPPSPPTSEPPSPPPLTEAPSIEKSQSVRLFARYKRDVLYDNRAVDEYGGCFKYSLKDKIMRGCVKTNEISTYCGTSKTDCFVCTDGDGCNSSVTVMASAILGFIGVAVLRILQ